MPSECHYILLTPRLHIHTLRIRENAIIFD